MRKGLIAWICAVALVCIEAPGAVSEMVESGLGPQVRSAVGDVWDLSRITVTFTMNVVGALDPFFYYIEDNNNTFNSILVTNVTYGASSNVIVLTLESPRDSTVIYNLILADHSIQDRYGHRLADPTTVRVKVPTVFQNGWEGYAGTQDTEIRFSAPDSATGGQAPIVITDSQDGTPAGAVHGLLRFDYMFGGGPGQVPLGAIIIKAALRLYTDDPSDRATPVRMMRMLAPWDETSTWNSLGSGIDETNGVEAGVTDALIVTDQDNSFLEIDVTAAVQSWANGEQNYGWAFLPTGPNGWRFASSENAAVSQRPALLIEDLYPPPPCQILEEPQSTTISAGEILSLRVVASGAGLRYQWFKNRLAIAGATNSTLQVPRARPSDSGDYFVIVQTIDPTACTSKTATVMVLCDNYPVQLVSAVGNADQSTISLVFNRSIDPALAQNITNYAISGGLNITSASVNGSQVMLTTSPTREIGRNYTLTIWNLQDVSCFNRIYPNPATASLTQDVRLLSFDALWRYQNEGLDLGSAWTWPRYDDSTWAQGRGLLGFETTAATLTALSNQNALVNTRLDLTTSSGDPIITDYFRTFVNIPFDTAGVAFTIQHVVDDGAVFYANGLEVARYNMPAGPIHFQTGALTAPSEGVMRSLTNVAGFVCGLNAVAVEVHNQAPTSGDILFGAEIIARVPSFAVPFCGSGIKITRGSNQTMTIEWAPPLAHLQETEILDGQWRDIPAATSPWPMTPAGQSRFYRLRIP